MNKKLVIWGLVVLVAGIIIHTYGGCGKKHEGTTVGSSSYDTLIKGTIIVTTSGETMVPLGGATVTAQWPEETKSIIAKGITTKSHSTRSRSDGSYEIANIPRNTVVTVTITSPDTIQSVETVTTSATASNASAILKGRGKKIGLIKKSQETVLNTFDDTSMPKCQVSIPVDAVSGDVDNVFLTPTHQGETLPTLPDGSVFLAGADFSAPSEITFASGKEATPYIILPPSVKAEELSTADIKLMEFINGQWVIANGKGKLFTTGEWLGYIGPHDIETPAKLKGVHPWCWVVAQPSPAQISGTVKNAAGTPVSGALIFGGGTKTHTKSDGTYTLNNIAVLKNNTLVPINVTAVGYQMGYQFVSLSPGGTVNNVDFTLEAVQQLAEVYGKVTDAADNTTPIYGAIVTLQTNPSIRGMKYDNKNTLTDLTDDTFYVIPPPGVSINQYKWMLTIPPLGNKFTSTVENGSEVVLNQLAREAGITDLGAYKVELEVTYTGGKKVTVSGGFLLKLSGLSLYIADVKLPMSLSDQLVLKTVTDSQGDYRFVNLPTGETLYARAKALDFITSGTVEISALNAGEQRLQDFALAAVTSDTEPPTVPGSLTGTARSAFSILLTWSASSDNVGIDYYRVYRGILGVPGLGEIGKTTNTSYIDSGLSPNTTYKYQVSAVDKANNSTNSDIINITTPSDVIDTTPPTTPTGLTAVVVSSSQINLSWWASSDNVGVIGYKVYRDGALCSTLNATSYADTGLTASTEYEYKVAAYDAAGNISDYSNVVTATTHATADTQPPTVPTGLTANPVSSGQINLSWSASTDDRGVTGYKVYRNNNYIASIVGTSYSDNGLLASTNYTYNVAAYDAAGNTSAQSAAVNATTLPFVDTAPPSVPTGLSVDTYSVTTVTIFWSASSDNVGVTGYKLYRDGVYKTSVNNTSYTDSGLLPSTLYSYTVAAYDAAGNVSDQSSLLEVTTTGDSTAPSIPTGLVVTAVASSQIDLTWNPSSDNVGVIGYKVYRNSGYIVSVVGTSYNDTGLTGSTNYAYTVAAYDAAGNTSNQSDSVNETTPAAVDTEAPSVPTGLNAVAASCTQMNLTWNASTDNIEVTGYKVYRNSVYFTSVTNTAYSNIGLSPATAYTYTVAAYDAAGNISAQCAPFPATTPADTTAPGVPSGLTGIAASPTQINISWNASSDNVGVTGYKVYRNGTLCSTLNATSYADTGLTPGTTYAYTVLAYDAANNPSAQCTPVNITTQQGLPVAYWKFDETSGTTANDSSGNGNNGTVYGATWSGGALSFDGVDDYVEVPPSASLNPATQITVQVWIKPNSVSQIGTIVGKRLLDALRVNEGKVDFWLSAGGSSYGIYSVSTISVGTWYHLAATYDGSSIKLYINGILENSISATGDIGETYPLNTVIGKYPYPTPPTQFFNGKIDDVKIYNYARSGADIQAEYNYAVKSWAQIACGRYHTIALKNDGSLWTWGDNSYGQLGLGDTARRSLPTRVGTDTDWKTIADGLYYTIAIKNDGTLWAWGYNGYGQLGLGDTNNRLTPCKVGTDTNWVIAARSGYHNTAAIKNDGTLWTWGKNDWGELGLGDWTNRSLPTKVGTDTNWQAVTTSVVAAANILAIKTDGTLWSWGYNYYGNLGLGDTVNRNSPTQVGTNWKALAEGGHNLAIKTDGTLWAWGANIDGQMGLGVTGGAYYTPNKVGSDTDWQMVAARNRHSLALKTDGTLWAWGYNGMGQLGLGDTGSRNSPVRVGTDTNWQVIVSGDDYSVGIKSDGTLWAWGWNAQGQLGLGDTSDRGTPTQVGK